MELPADATPRDRMFWALLAAIVGIAHDGPENHRPLQRLQAACRTFGVPRDEFDDCARRLNLHYYRPWDAYIGREDLAEAARLTAIEQSYSAGRSGMLH